MTGGFRLRRWLGVLVLALACCLLAACSGDDPGPTPTASVQPAETPSVTATKPALLIGKPTADSAVAFVKYFIDAYNYAYATYDTSLLDQISQPTCKYCASVMDDVTRLERAKTRVRGTEVVFVDAFPSPDKITDGTYIVAVTSQRPGVAISEGGKVTKVDGAKDTESDFGLDWDGGKWLIRGVRTTKQGQTWPA